MIWSYGVTTVPSRFNTFLPTTLASLAKAGFDNPRLFIDGIGVLPDTLKKYPITPRNPGVRPFGNWVLSAWELYLREPLADRYAIFQDDFVTYVNLKQYLEQCYYPTLGYCNLYTFPQNEKKDKSGWYESNQQGLGAVALVFSNEALRVLLRQEHMVDRPLDQERGHRSLDGGIVTAMKKAGWKEFVHSPSLVQHIGDVSTIQSKNVRHPKAKSFLGENTDAMTLFGKVEQVTEQPRTLPPSANRIGLVGYNCNTGLGELNRQIATYCDIDAWLIKKHQHELTRPEFPSIDNITCVNGQTSKIDQFLKLCDVAVFCEMPYFNELIMRAKKFRRRLVCVPMMEWMPSGCKGWPKLVDLFICPTQQCYRYFRESVPCVYFPWPIDTERFAFKQRTVVKKFLFLGGQGGWKGRKGIDVIRAAKKLCPELPIAVRTQQKINWDVDVEVLPPTKENNELYSDGDVLLVPHSVDGLGLEPLEALSCGMPVVSTDGEPWNEYLQIDRISASSERRSVNRPVDWYLPDPKSLVSVCQKLLGTDITKQSSEAREWAEKHSWSSRKERFIELVLHGEGVK